MTSVRIHRASLTLALVAVASLLAAAATYALPFPLSLFSRDGNAAGHLHVLMINGGGRREQNYQSHLLHVQALLRVLLDDGVPRRNVTILSSDGADPAEDLAVRDPQPEADFWLLRGTQLERALGTPITYVNSSVPDMTLEPATKDGLRKWFKQAAKRLHGRDTLLLYVTDHGSKNTDDTSNNRIVLWGKDESVSVVELKEMLSWLDPRVRVVSLMSQCFSGAFANLSFTAGGDGGATLPRGNVCGYFSSTPDRAAYGCYPENRGKDNVGHSFEFIKALAASGHFAEAHAQVLVNDRTPDVPLKSSDFYLEERLRRAAEQRGEELAAVVDDLLREAWRNKAAWEPEIRLLDRVSHAVGYFSPRSLAELETQSKLLPDVSDKLKAHASAWHGALRDLAQENVRRFLKANVLWDARVRVDELVALDPSAKRTLTGLLLPDLVAFTHADDTTDARLGVLKEKADLAAAASYRMQVRLGVVLRMRAVLTSIAGRVYMATQASDAERRAFQDLQTCEDLSLAPPPGQAAPQIAAADPFPSYDEELALAHDVSPAWMGIRFKPRESDGDKKNGMQEGAVAVMAVYPDSPAKAAGLEVGDLVLGPPGKPFVERNQIREWTMLSKVEEPTRLIVLRGHKRLRLTLVPEPFPLTWPDLPTPPKVGSLAPPLHVDSYRGAVPAALVSGKPHLLFFWATWCAPCKASLPEVLAFEEQTHTPVIAITDELKEQLAPFFAAFDKPFPKAVAMDAYRKAYVAYGVSGTPTFVLIDGDGKVQSYSTGYTADKGLGIEGWTWAERPATAAQ